MGGMGSPITEFIMEEIAEFVQQEPNEEDAGEADIDPRTIYVKLLTCETATFIMKGNETVYKLKKLINGLEGMADISPNKQRLISSGKQLKDDMTVATCHMQYDKTIYIQLVLRLKGGGVKRPRLEEMRGRIEDPVEVQAVFNITTFVSDSWLESIDKDTCTSYLQFLETHKHHDRVVVKTVDVISEIKVLQDRICFFVPTG